MSAIRSIPITRRLGGAGRDGEKAEAVLFFRQEDMGVQKFHSGEGKLEAEQIEKAADVIAEQQGPVEPEEIAEQTDLSDRKLTTVINRLEDVGALEILPDGAVQLNEGTDVSEAAEAAVEQQDRRKEMKAERIRQMQEYADTSACRREHLLRYFGDAFTGPCNNCDNCEACFDRGERRHSGGSGRRDARGKWPRNKIDNPCSMLF